MNLITVSTLRRPFETRLCLESLCRAQRWYHWADYIAVAIPSNVDPEVKSEAFRIKGRNPDVEMRIWLEPPSIGDPHAASKWMLDTAFEQGADVTLYMEDDVIISPDAFVLLDATKEVIDPAVVGCCLYHETIPEHYRDRPPDPKRVHFYNGLNTCGGTAFKRRPYLNLFSPQWNCKQQEPRGFDYSAHYLMYLHGLYMAYPDLSRSMNIGFQGGQLSRGQWQRYCGRSIWTQTAQALKSPFQFEFPNTLPNTVRETWMEAELQAKGMTV